MHSIYTLTEAWMLTGPQRSGHRQLANDQPSMSFLEGLANPTTRPSTLHYSDSQIVKGGIHCPAHILQLNSAAGGHLCPSKLMLARQQPLRACSRSAGRQSCSGQRKVKVITLTACHTPTAARLPQTLC